MGAVYVFDFDGTSWNETARLTASDGAGSERFGSDVGIHGDRLIAGARNKNSFKGAAYIFEFDGTNWSETAQFTPTPPAGSSLEFLGFAVDIYGDRAVAGAPGENVSNTREGVVYVFDFDGAIWNTTKLMDSDPTVIGNFGNSLALEGDRLVAGRPGDAGSRPEAVYVLDFDGSSWNSTKLTASDAILLDDNQYGETVALSGDRVVVGASFDDEADNTAGAAYVYDFDGTTWNETKLLASDAASSDDFGVSVGIDGDVILIGAHLTDDNGAEAGSAYIFGLLDADMDGYLDEDELACNSDPNDFYSVPSGAVSGAVTTGSNGIAGITVKVLDALDPMIVLASGTTDAQGDYSFADVPQGDIQVMVVEPLGFSAATNNVDEAVACNTTSTVDFSLVVDQDQLVEREIYR